MNTALFKNTQKQTHDINPYMLWIKKFADVEILQRNQIEILEMKNSIFQTENRVESLNNRISDK